MSFDEGAKPYRRRHVGMMIAIQTWKGACPLRILTLQGSGFCPPLFAAAFLLVASAHPALMAQGLSTQGAIDAIVGSDVQTGEEPVAADEQRIVAAIEKTSENTSQVRKSFNIDKVEILFLPDFGEKETAVDAKIAEYKDQIAALHSEIQGSAIFYHAVDSRQILMNDIIALEFDDHNGVTIFVAGKEPGTGN
jgi:hypothetical protein